MKETFYFSHDYNARSDAKIKRLLAKHGYIGYGIYWAIIEDLYQNANALQKDYDCIAYDLRTKSDIIKSIINDFDLFQVNDNVFGSLSVQKRIDERDAKSKKARQSAFYRWNKDETDANAMRTHTDSNAIKEKKGKERKRKDIILKPKYECEDESKIELEENKAPDVAPEFNFRKSFEELGVEKDVLDIWLKVRKSKKATNSILAFKAIVNQIAKTNKTPNECIKIAAEKSWKGFEADWINNISTSQPKPQSPIINSQAGSSGVDAEIEKGLADGSLKLVDGKLIRNKN